MDLLTLGAIAFAAAFGFMIVDSLRRRRRGDGGERPDKLWGIVFDICERKVELVQFVKRNPLSNEYISPSKGYILWAPAFPSKTTVVVKGRAYPAVEALGCGGIYTTEDLRHFLSSLSISSVAIGDEEIDVANPDALAKLYRRLVETWREQEKSGGRIWTSMRGGVKFAIALPNYDKIAQIIGRYISEINKAALQLGNTVEATAEVVRMAKMGRRGGDYGWVMWIIIGLVVVLAMLFAFGKL